MSYSYCVQIIQKKEKNSPSKLKEFQLFPVLGIKVCRGGYKRAKTEFKSLMSYVLTDMELCAKVEALLTEEFSWDCREIFETHQHYAVKVIALMYIYLISCLEMLNYSMLRRRTNLKIYLVPVCMLNIV